MQAVLPSWVSNHQAGNDLASTHGQCREFASRPLRLHLWNQLLLI
jgi:hypothetical protein